VEFVGWAVELMIGFDDDEDDDDDDDEELNRFCPTR